MRINTIRKLCKWITLARPYGKYSLRIVADAVHYIAWTQDQRREVGVKQ